jgi:hypothetical protein
VEFSEDTERFAWTPKHNASNIDRESDMEGSIDGMPLLFEQLGPGWGIVWKSDTSLMEDGKKACTGGRMSILEKTTP